MIPFLILLAACNSKPTDEGSNAPTVVTPPTAGAAADGVTAPPAEKEAKVEATPEEGVELAPPAAVEPPSEVPAEGEEAAAAPADSAKATEPQKTEERPVMGPLPE